MITEKAKKAYEKYKKFKKTKGYYDSIVKIPDEDTRPAELFKVGLNETMKRATKVLGEDLTKHPYFTYHKVHLEALGRALTASETHDNAMNALQRAITAADGTEALNRQLGSFVHRKNALKWYYQTAIADGLQILHDIRMSGPAMPSREHARAQLADSGHTPESLRAVLDSAIYELRAGAAELFFDSVDLLALVQMEFQAASAAYVRFSEKVKKLTQSKSTVDQIAGRGAEYQRQLAWADRVLANNPAADAVIDPSVYARRQRDLVNDQVQTLARICDTVMSDDVYNPSLMITRIGSL